MVMPIGFKSHHCIGHYGTFKKVTGEIHDSDNLKLWGVINIATLNSSILLGMLFFILTGDLKNSGFKLFFLNHIHTILAITTPDS